MAKPLFGGALVLVLLLAPVLASAQTPSVEHRVKDLEAAVARLQQTVADQQALIGGLQSQIAKLRTVYQNIEKSETMKLNPYLTVTTDEELGLPLVRLTGVNLQLVSGLGAAGGCLSYDLPTNGLGNLIVGYNEARTSCPWMAPAVRTGSHNVVIGSAHSYSGQGGFVAGQANTIASTGTSVSGGLFNTADGLWASVSAGQGNQASANFGSVSGGVGNTIDGAGYGSWIGGGAGNTAMAAYTSIMGGQHNTTNGYGGVISAGWQNSTNGVFSWVGGGFQNQALGDFSSVTGGNGNVASGQYEVVP